MLIRSIITILSFAIILTASGSLGMASAQTNTTMSLSITDTRDPTAGFEVPVTSAEQTQQILKKYMDSQNAGLIDININFGEGGEGSVPTLNSNGNNTSVIEDQAMEFAKTGYTVANALRTTGLTVPGEGGEGGEAGIPIGTLNLGTICGNIGFLDVCLGE